LAEDAATLTAHRMDYWILAHLRARQGRLAGGPACVVRPRSAPEVAAAVRTAQRLGVAVVPYGAGSGVVGGATPPDRALVVDLSAMKGIRVDPAARTARVEGSICHHSTPGRVRGGRAGVETETARSVLVGSFRLRRGGTACREGNIHAED